MAGAFLNGKLNPDKTMNPPLGCYTPVVWRGVRKRGKSWRGGLSQYYPVNDKARAFHLSDAKIRCLFCANQSGKSTTAEAEVASLMQGTHRLQEQGKVPKPPLQWRIVTIDFPILQKNHIPKFRQIVNPTFLRGGSWSDAYSARDMVLHYADGGFVEFMSYEQDADKFATVQRDGVWFDEEPPRAIWEENQMRLLRRKGRVILTMTPDNGCTWVYDDFELPWSTGSLPPDVACFRWSLYENPYISPEEIARAEKGLDEQTRRIKIYGEFVHRTGLIFEDFKNREPWVYNHFPIPPHWPRWVCIDSHPRKDHAVLLVAVSPSGELWAYKEIFESNDIDTTCKILKAELNGIHPYEVLIDSASKGDDYQHGVSLFDYYSESLYDMGLRQPTLAFKDVDAGLVAVRSYFQWDPKLVPLPEHRIPYDPRPPAQATGGVRLHISRQGCPKLIWQLSRYVYDDYTTRKMADRRDPRQIPRKKDDDLIDDLRYIVMEEPHFVDMSQESAKGPEWGWRPEADESDGAPEVDADGFGMAEYETTWMEA